MFVFTRYFKLCQITWISQGCLQNVRTDQLSLKTELACLILYIISSGFLQKRKGPNVLGKNVKICIMFTCACWKYNAEQHIFELIPGPAYDYWSPNFESKIKFYQHSHCKAFANEIKQRGKLAFLFFHRVHTYTSIIHVSFVFLPIIHCKTTEHVTFPPYFWNSWFD